MGIYFFGQTLGVKSCLHGHFNIGLKRLLLPVNYWRYPVFRHIDQFFNNSKQLKVLDIGSPKLLAVYLAVKRKHRVYATDIQDQTIFTVWNTYYRDIQNNGSNGSAGYIADLQDARDLKYENDEFDIVYSVSVIEHIPDHGDSEAMQEIHRVLKPGGLAIIEVPYALKTHETVKNTDVYERQFNGEPVFYQRHYDEETLRSRLIEPSKLKLVEKVILGERLPFEDLYESFPVFGKLLFFPFEALISVLNHKKIDEQQRQKDSARDFKRAMDVTLILQKNQGGA
ncbi:MAG: class I SAM-dependent methyltransferase [bacterium]